VIQPGEVISYLEMCRAEDVNLQRGMNYRLRRDRSVFLMSRRLGAPYADHVEDGGRVLIYEGHDSPRQKGGPDPKTIDQPVRTPAGSLTENGKFLQAVRRIGDGEPAEIVQVYEKIRAGIWVFNGPFRLVDAWEEPANGRRVFKFRLEVVPDAISSTNSVRGALEQNRLIPTEVKLAVWRRDRGQCVECGSTDNLHFDHIIPYSLGGSSLVAENIQLLCARHNLAKHDKIA